MVCCFQSMKTKSVWTNAGEGEEEEEKNSPRSTTTTRLTRLAPELVVMVASHLDVSSYLALASSSNVLLDILTSQVQWKALLQKTKISARKKSTSTLQIHRKYVDIPGVSMETMNALDELESNREVAAREEVSQEVYQLAAFLKKVHDPEGKLLLLLLDTICAKFPADESREKWQFRTEVFSVSCPCRAFAPIPHTIHRVSSSGFFMLEKVETIARGTCHPYCIGLGCSRTQSHHGEPVQKLVSYEAHEVDPAPWGSFESRTSRQKQKVGKLEMTEANTGYKGCQKKSREDWLKLLGTCKSWKIEQLNNIILDPALENIQEMLEGLADEAVRGEIGVMFTSERTMWQTKRSQLEKVWKITREWQVVLFSLFHFLFACFDRLFFLLFFHLFLFAISFC